MKTPFEQGIRVALVKRKDGPNLFGVAMAGGRHVVPLPSQYDGRTSVFWVQGWIIVTHPDEPSLLADTTLGTTSPMNEHAMAAAMMAFQAPRLAATH